MAWSRLEAVSSSTCIQKGIFSNASEQLQHSTYHKFTGKAYFLDSERLEKMTPINDLSNTLLEIKSPEKD